MLPRFGAATVRHLLLLGSDSSRIQSRSVSSSLAVVDAVWEIKGVPESVLAEKSALASGGSCTSPSRQSAIRYKLPWSPLQSRQSFRATGACREQILIVCLSCKGRAVGHVGDWRRGRSCLAPLLGLAVALCTPRVRRGQSTRLMCLLRRTDAAWTRLSRPRTAEGGVLRASPRRVVPTTALLAPKIRTQSPPPINLQRQPSGRKPAPMLAPVS